MTATGKTTLESETIGTEPGLSVPVSEPLESRDVRGCQVGEGLDKHRGQHMLTPGGPAEPVVFQD